MGLLLVNWEVLILLFSNYPDTGEKKTSSVKKARLFHGFIIRQGLKSLSHS